MKVWRCKLQLWFFIRIPKATLDDVLNVLENLKTAANEAEKDFKKALLQEPRK